ncbi:MAG: 50S ribosomal protein L13 [Candidatus Bathyarchaeota archaeon]|nr:50S ribosomal protein L13 [Candidatus Bathyarchaeota archaeon]
MDQKSKTTSLVDADNLILGRMATVVAKRLLQGEHVTILNAEKAVISGKRESIVKRGKEKLEIGHPRKGPYFPRRPDRFVKRTIRGMLPRKKPKGKESHKRLQVFVGIPPEFKDSSLETITEARAEKLKCRYIRLEDLANELGWSPLGG